MMLFLRFLRSNAVNIFIYIAGCITLGLLYKIPDSAIFIIKWLPWVLFFMNLMLSFIFNKSKLFFMTLLLMMSYLFLSLPNNTDLFQRHILMAVGLATPLNIFIFSSVQERGITSRNGKTKLSFIGLECLMLFYFLAFKETLFITLDHIKVMPDLLMPFVVVNDVVTLVFWITLFYFLTTDLIKPYLIKNVSLFMIMFLYMAFMRFDHPLWIELCFIFSNLTVLVALMRKSYKMAYHDDLTGIPGRRALNEDLDKLSGMYAIAMIDIDHFKQFNDKYGHDVGDEALRYVARTIDRTVEKGKFYRFGGEEFTLIYPKLAKEEVMVNLENVRRTIESNGFISHSARHKKKRKNKIKLTISIGVSDHRDPELRPYEVLKKADRGLYTAKKEGRNCIKRV